MKMIDTLGYKNAEDLEREEKELISIDSDLCINACNVCPFDDNLIDVIETHFFIKGKSDTIKKLKAAGWYKAYGWIVNGRRKAFFKKEIA